MKTVFTSILFLLSLMALCAQDNIQSDSETHPEISNAINYALIFVVQDYIDTVIAEIPNSFDDAEEFCNILITRYTFEEENISFLKNPTKADIIRSFKRIQERINTDENLLIYFTGQGFYDEEKQNGYWLPSDAKKDYPENWLSNTEIIEYVANIKSKHTLMIEDACFLANFNKRRAAFNDMLTIDRAYKMNSRKVMTSGNGTLKEEPERSTLIKYLLVWLNTNNSVYMSTQELFSQIRIGVLNNSDLVPKYGPIWSVGDNGGDFIFALRQ